MKLREEDTQILNYLGKRTGIPWGTVTSEIVDADGSAHVYAFLCELTGRIFITREDVVKFSNPEQLIVARIRQMQGELNYELDRICKKLQA